MSLIIGLTGGIGSGKSTVANEFKEFGIQVVDADKVAREIVEPGKAALNEISSYFGSEVINSNGALDRSKLRTIVFQSESKKKWLNALLHPLIRDNMLSQIAESKSDYVILEAPLLFENNLTQYTQYNLVVDVTENLQVERAMQRDGNTELQIKAIMGAQISRQLRLQQADYIIDNNSSNFILLKQKVKELHTEFLSL